MDIGDLLFIVFYLLKKRKILSKFLRVRNKQAVF